MKQKILLQGKEWCDHHLQFQRRSLHLWVVHLKAALMDIWGFSSGTGCVAFLLWAQRCNRDIVFGSAGAGGPLDDKQTGVQSSAARWWWYHTRARCV